MSVVAIVLLCVLFAGLFIFLKIYKNAGKKMELPADNSQEEFVENFDEEFFKRTQNGETYQLFLSISSQRDCAVVRSLLSADNIPSYVENEHMNNIYGGIAGTMNAVVAIKLYVLSSDYDTAFEITKDFISKKIENMEEKETSERENLQDELNKELAIPENFTTAKEFFGITIWPKVVEK